MVNECVLKPMWPDEESVMHARVVRVNGSTSLSEAPSLNAHFREQHVYDTLLCAILPFAVSSLRYLCYKDYILRSVVRIGRAAKYAANQCSSITPRREAVNGSGVTCLRTTRVL